MLSDSSGTRGCWASKSLFVCFIYNDFFFVVLSLTISLSPTFRNTDNTCYCIIKTTICHCIYIIDSSIRKNPGDEPGQRKVPGGTPGSLFILQQLEDIDIGLFGALIRATYDFN